MIWSTVAGGSRTNKHGNGMWRTKMLGFYFLTNLWVKKYSSINEDYITWLAKRSWLMNLCMSNSWGKIDTLQLTAQFCWDLILYTCIHCKHTHIMRSERICLSVRSARACIYIYTRMCFKKWPKKTNRFTPSNSTRDAQKFKLLTSEKKVQVNKWPTSQCGSRNVKTPCSAKWFWGDSYASFIKVSHRGCDELLDEPTWNIHPSVICYMTMEAMAQLIKAIDHDLPIQSPDFP